VVRAAES